MANEDLLVNIDVDTKPAKRGVDELNKSLSENTKQSKKIKEELAKLEKEYKSIATAIKKLPAKDVDKLNRSVRKATKTSKELGDQFVKTEQKLSRVKERTVEATDAFAVLGATVLSFKNFQPIIRFATQVVNASQAVLSFQANTVPLIKDTLIGLQKGYKAAGESATAFSRVFKLIIPAVQEQVYVWKGYQQVQIRTLELNHQVREGFRSLSSSASYVQRKLIGLNEFIDASKEGFTRVVRVLKTLGEGLRTTGKIIGEFHAAWFGTFGPQTAGAAQVNKWQRLLLKLRYEAEMAGLALRKAFSEVMSYSTKAFRNISPLAAQFGRLGKTKGVELLAKAMDRLAPVLSELGGIARQMLDKLTIGFSKLMPLFAQAREGSRAFFTAISGSFSKVGPMIAEANAMVRVLIKNLEVKLPKMLEAAKGGFASFASEVGKAAVSGKGFNKSFFALVEGMNVAGIGLLGFGTLLKQTDNAVLDFIGSTVQLAGLFSVSLAGALSVLLGVIGGVVSAIGGKLIDAMNNWEASFRKVQGVTQAFEFVIRGFSKTFDEKFIGSIDGWNAKIKSLTETTTFSAFEFQKAVKIMIAEGAQLGITFEQNSKILERVADIAAGHQKSVEEVSLAVAKGMGGNSASLQAMGIFVDNASLQNSKYAKSLGIVVDSLDKTAKAQLIMNAILDQTKPFVGAAADQLNTIVGSNKQYEATLDSIAAKLGSQSVIFAKLTQVQTSFLKVVDGMPTAFFDVIGVLVDFLGVGLKVVGTLISLSVTLVTLRSLWEALGYSVAKFSMAQTALSATINAVRGAVGLEAVAVTSLNGAMVSMGQAILPSIKTGMASFKKILITTTAHAYAYTASLLFTKAGWATIIAGATAASKAVWGFTLQLLRNPLFIKASLILGAIYGLVKAFQELSKELTFLKKSSDESSKGVKETSKALSVLSKIVTGLGDMFIKFFKLIILGWMEIVTVLEIAAQGFKKLWYMAKGFFTDASKELKQVEEQGWKLVDQMVELQDAVDKTFAGDKIELHAKRLKSAAKATSDLVKESGKLSDALKLNEKTRKSLEIAVLGDEVQVASEKFLNATEALNKLRNVGVFKVGAEIIMPTEENLAKMAAGKLLTSEGKKVTTPPQAASEALIAEAAIAAEEARLNLVKIRRDFNLKMAEEIRSNEIMLLEFAGKEIEALKIKGKVQLEALEKSKEAQEIINKLTAKELENYRKLESTIKASTAAAIAKKQAEMEAAAQSKAASRLQEAQDLKKAYEEIYKTMLEGSGNLVGAERLRLATSLEQIDAIETAMGLHEEYLDTTGKLKKEYAAVLDSARKLAKEKFDDFADTQSFTAKLQKALDDIDASNIGGEFVKWLSKAGVGLVQVVSGGISGAMALVGNMKEAFSGLSMDKGFGENMAAAADGMKTMFSDIDWKEMGLSVASSVGSALVGVGDAVGMLFDPEAIGKLSEFLGEFLEKLPENIIKAFKNLDQVIDSFIAAFPAAVASLMDALPGIFQSLISKAPMLIDAVVSGLSVFIEKLPGIIGMLLDALPGIITKLLEALPQLIEGLLSSVGTIIGQLISAIPGVLVAIMEELPAILESIIVGLMDAMDKIAAALIDFLIGGGLEKIVKAFIRMVPRIALALVNGFVKGIQRSVGRLFSGIKAPPALANLPGKFAEGIKDLAKNTTKEASKLFKVMDLEEKAKGLAGAMTGADVGGGAIQAGKEITGVLTKFLEMLKKVWLWVYDKILAPVLDGLQAVWTWVYENVFQPAGKLLASVVNGLMVAIGVVMGIVQRVWAGVVQLLENWITMLKAVWDAAGILLNAWLDGFKAIWDSVAVIWDGMTAALRGVFDLFKDYFDNIGQIFNTAFEGIKEFFTKIFQGKIEEAFSGIFKVFGTIGTQIFDGLKSSLEGAASIYLGIGQTIFNGLKTALGGLGKIVGEAFSSLSGVITDTLNKINPANIFSKMFSTAGASGKGTVESALGIDVPFLAFAKGGIVPGKSPLPGDTEANDRVLAMLSPGEAIVPRTVMEDPFWSSIIKGVIENRLNLPKFALGGIKVGGTFEKIATGDFSGAASDVKNVDAGSVLDALGISKMWETVEDMVMNKMVMKMFEANKFHGGGFVGGMAFGGEVPAMLQRGEYVINRQAVRSLGLGALDRLNRGQAGSQEFNYNINLEVKADNLPDESFIRQRMIPAMKRELKAASLRGEFLISNRGVREA